MALCDDCRRGPCGIDGHASLGMQPVDQAVLFKCSSCRSLWARSYEGGGVFAWMPVLADAPHREAAD